MGVIINLKEIFAADGQEIFTDKINFNFNKLLELGIGEQGIQGIQGPAGAAGPAGIQGPDGERGNKWFVGVGDPNGQVFTDLIIGDFYLETTDSSIWQYQGSPASWIQVTDLSQVVINIIEAEGSPFVRGFGEASPLDDRFITFTKRGNNIADITADVTLGNISNNDTLLLTNWNERVTTIDNFPLSTDDEFNAIQSISLDHSLSSLGRYHLEFSSLNNISGNVELSNLNNNLKVRYLKTEVTSTGYPVSNEFINIGRFSMSIPETASLASIDQQGIFEFITPKYQDAADGGSAIKQNATLRIGSSEPLSETSLMDIAVDGIDITVDVKAINFGLIRELETYTSIQTLPLGLSGDFGMINTSNLVNGLMVRSNTYHTKSLNTIHVDSKYQANDNLSTMANVTAQAQGYQGIFSDGKYLMAVSPYSDAQDSYDDYNTRGYLRIWDITDPDSPLLIASKDSSSIISPLFVPAGTYDIHGNPYGQGPFPGYNDDKLKFTGSVPLTGARDITFAGKYGIIVRRKPGITFAPPIGFESFVDSFLIFELDSNLEEVKPVSWLGASPTFSDFMIGSSFVGSSIPELDYARRVKISGNYAYVMSDSLTAVTGTSYFTAIDITNPARPFTDADYIKSHSNAKHIDFDIEGEVAYILSMGFTGSPFFTYEINIKKVSIFDSTVLSTAQETNTTILTPPFQPSDSGAIKVIGRRIYVVHEDNLYIYDTGDDISITPTLISNTTLPTNYDGYDIEVSGNFAYIYADRGSSRSSILTYDISDDANPLLLEPYEQFQSAPGNGRPSKMTMVGDRIYTIAAGNGTEVAGVNSVKIDGINSPAAKIGNIHSKDIKVSNSVSVAQTLQVGRSATIGSGGLWVDKGNGIHSDSTISVNLSLRDPDGFAGVVGTSIKANGLASDSTGLPFLFGSITDFRDIDFSATILSLLTVNQITLANIDSQQTIRVNNIDVDNITTTQTVVGIEMNFAGITAGAPVEGINISGEAVNRFSGSMNIEGMLRLLDDGGAGYVGSDKGLYFFGTGANRSSFETMPDSPETQMGQWSLEYFGGGADTQNCGLNFWKPNPSLNQGNGKVFISDAGPVAIGFDFSSSPIDFDYGVSGNTFIGKAYAYNTSWISGSAVVRLAVNGPIGCTYVVTTSDSRLKDNVIDINDPLERIIKTRPVFYSWKDQDAKIPHGGFLAQEIEDVIPEAIRINQGSDLEGGQYSLHYDTILAVSVGAIQELHKTIEEKDSTIKQLEARLKAIEEKLGL